MSLVKLLNYAAVFSLIIFCITCGGKSGDFTSELNSTYKEPLGFLKESNVQYIGKTESVVINEDNVKVIYTSFWNGTNVTNAGSQKAGGIPVRATSYFKILKLRLLNNPISRKKTEQVNGSYGGTLTITDNVDGNYIGNVKFVYHNYSDELGVISNGEINYILEEYDSELEAPSLTTIVTREFHIEEEGERMKFAGVISVKKDSVSNTYTGTLNVNIYNETLNQYSKFENIVVRDTHKNLSDEKNYTEEITGSYYIGNLGKVSLSTPSPLVYTYRNLEDPSGGVLQVNGSHSIAKANMLSSDIVFMQIDSNNDGVFEKEAYSIWDKLGNENIQFYNQGYAPSIDFFPDLNSLYRTNDEDEVNVNYSSNILTILPNNFDEAVFSKKRESLFYNDQSNKRLYEYNLKSDITFLNAKFNSKPRALYYSEENDELYFTLNNDNVSDVLGDHSSRIIVFDINKNKQRQDISFQASSFDLVASKDLLIMSTDDKPISTVNSYQMTSGNLVNSLKIGSGTYLALHPSGNSFYTCGDGTFSSNIKIFTANGVSGIQASQVTDAFSKGKLWISPDGKYIISNLGVVYNTNTMEVVRTLLNRSNNRFNFINEFKQVIFSEDGETVYALHDILNSSDSRYSIRKYNYGSFREAGFIDKIGSPLFIFESKGVLYLIWRRSGKNILEKIKI